MSTTEAGVEPANASPGIGSTITALFQRHMVALAVWAVLILVVVAAVIAARANHARTVEALSSPNPAVRTQEILTLARQGALGGALASTEDPNSPSTSPQNVRSASIREGAAATVDSLVASGQLQGASAMNVLFDLSKDTDTTVQADADTGLATLAKKSTANLRQLVAQLANGDPDISTAAATALGQVGGAPTAELVAPMVNNPDATAAAQTALVNIGAPSVASITPMLDRSDVDLRSQLITTLGSIGAPSAIPALIAQVHAQPLVPAIHRLAIIALADVVIKSYPPLPPAPSPGAPSPPRRLTAADEQMAAVTLPIFTKTLDDTAEDSFARARSALVLGRLGLPGAVTSLVGALGDYDSRVAQAALTGIQEVGPSAVPALARAAHSPSLHVRVAAASGLGGIDDPTALAAMPVSLSDPSFQVRMAGAQALGIGAGPAAIPLLIPLLGDPSGEVAEAASESLHLIGRPAIPALVASLRSSKPAIAFNASQALHAFGNAAVPAVVAALKSGPQSQTIWAAVTLGQLHDAAAAPALKSLAAAAPGRVKWAANQALEQLGQA